MLFRDVIWCVVHIDVVWCELNWVWFDHRKPILRELNKRIKKIIYLKCCWCRLWTSVEISSHFSVFYKISPFPTIRRDYKFGFPVIWLYWISIGKIFNSLWFLYHFQKAKELDPSDPMACHLLGMWYYYIVTLLFWIHGRD